MKTLALVLLCCLTCAGTSAAGILKMNCQKPVCPCTCYGSFFGFFPNQWHTWPGVPASPTAAAPPPAPARQPPMVMPPATMITPAEEPVQFQGAALFSR